MIAGTKMMILENTPICISDEVKEKIFAMFPKEVPTYASFTPYLG